MINRHMFSPGSADDYAFYGDDYTDCRDADVLPGYPYKGETASEEIDAPQADLFANMGRGFVVVFAVLAVLILIVTILRGN